MRCLQAGRQVAEGTRIYLRRVHCSSSLRPSSSVRTHEGQNWVRWECVAYIHHTACPLHLIISLPPQENQRVRVPVQPPHLA